MRDLALRQELTLVDGQPPRRVGLRAPPAAHRRRCGASPATATRPRTNGSSVQGGAGLPSDLDSAVDSTRFGAWLVGSVAGEPARSRSRRGFASTGAASTGGRPSRPALAATWRIGDATRLRAGGGLFTQSPGYEKLIQSDYFVDLSGELRALARSTSGPCTPSLGVERDLALGRERAGRGLLEGHRRPHRRPPRDRGGARWRAWRGTTSRPSSRRAFPPTPIITSFPVNGAAGRSWGFDVLRAEAAHARRAAHRLGVLHLGPRRARRVRAQPALRLRPAARGERSWARGASARSGSSAATARAFSGFPRTPVLGLRVAAQETPEGRLVPALDAEGRYVYETDSGGVANLNTARLPAFFRLDLRLSWKPRGDARALALLPRRDQRDEPRERGPDRPAPRLRPGLRRSTSRGSSLEPAAAIPFLPSVGVRFRF